MDRRRVADNVSADCTRSAVRRAHSLTSSGSGAGASRPSWRNWCDKDNTALAGRRVSCWAREVEADPPGLSRQTISVHPAAAAWGSEVVPDVDNLGVGHRGEYRGLVARVEPHDGVAVGPRQAVRAVLQVARPLVAEVDQDQGEAGGPVAYVGLAEAVPGQDGFGLRGLARHVDVGVQERLVRDLDLCQVLHPGHQALHVLFSGQRGIPRDHLVADVGPVLTPYGVVAENKADDEPPVAFEVLNALLVVACPFTHDSPPRYRRCYFVATAGSQIVVVSLRSGTQARTTPSLAERWHCWPYRGCPANASGTRSS